MSDIIAKIVNYITTEDTEAAEEYVGRNTRESHIDTILI
jgi:hypothetical protein